MSSKPPTKPRGTRLACSVRSSDGACGVYSVLPGAALDTVASVEPVKWDRPPTGPIVHGSFTIIGEMGMTGQVFILDQAKWEALHKAKLEPHYYAAILWGATPQKVVEDALLMTRRK
jgi:hypothetical protein